MVSDKEKIEKLKRDLGNAYSDVNTLKTTNTNLKTKNAELIEELKKSKEALDKANELINDKKTETAEISPLLDETDEAMKKLQDEINELKTINAELVAQHEEIKNQSAGIFTKSLAILGCFATGGWMVAGVSTILNRLRGTTSE